MKKWFRNGKSKVYWKFTVIVNGTKKLWVNKPAMELEHELLGVHC